MKTQRGTFYYIEMSGAYYAGTRPIMTVKTVVKTREWTDKEKEKPRYRRGDRYAVSYIPTLNPRAKHTVRAFGIKSVQTKKPKERVDVPAISSKFEDAWTEDFAKAKQFRLKSKAEAKAAELSAGLKQVKATVKFYEGDRT